MQFPGILQSLRLSTNQICLLSPDQREVILMTIPSVPFLVKYWQGKRFFGKFYRSTKKNALHLEFKLSCLLPLWECTALLKGTFTSTTIEVPLGEIQCDMWQQFDVKVTHVVGYQAPVLHLLGVIVTELEKCNGAIIKKACIEVFLHFFPPSSFARPLFLCR